MQVVRLTALHTGRFYPPENIPGIHFCQRLSQPQDHSVAGRIMSTKNSNDTIGNRTHGLPACSAVRQPSASKRTLLFHIWYVRFQRPRALSVGLWPLVCWDRGFETRRWYGYLSMESAVCFKGERSLFKKEFYRVWCV